MTAHAVRSRYVFPAVVSALVAGDLLAAPNERLGPDDPRRAPVERYEELFGPVERTRADDPRLQPLVDYWRGHAARRGVDHYFEPSRELLVAVAEVPHEAILNAEIAPRRRHGSVAAMFSPWLRISGADVGHPMSLPRGLGGTIEQVERDLDPAERVRFALSLILVQERTLDVLGDPERYMEFEGFRPAGRSTRPHVSVRGLRQSAWIYRATLIRHLLLPAIEATADPDEVVLARLRAELDRFQTEVQELRAAGYDRYEWGEVSSVIQLVESSISESAPVEDR